MSIDQLLKAIASFVKNLASVEVDFVAQQVFGSASDPRCLKLRQSIQYYINGTNEGFLRYKPVKATKGNIARLSLDSRRSEEIKN